MTASNQFSNYYKKISNAELLNILNNPRDYQPLALEAAKKEFSERQLSEADVKEAAEMLNEKRLQKHRQKEKIKSIENRIKAGGETLIDTLNPIQSGIPTIEKRIRWITIVMAVFFLYNFIQDFKTHVFYAKGIMRFPIESIIYLVLLLLLPVAVFTFWKRFKIGWILLVMYLGFSLIDVLLQTIAWSPDVSFLQNFFPQRSISTLIIQLIFLGGFIYVLCKQNIRNEFSINENKMIGTILVSGILYFFVIYANT